MYDPAYLPQPGGVGNCGRNSNNKIRRVHTPGETRSPFSAGKLIFNAMKEFVEREWGVETLDDESLQLQGGLTFREFMNLMEKAAALAEELEKYWPRFRRGFVDGWRAA